MEDTRRKAMQQIGDLWSLADHIEQNLVNLETEVAGKLFDLIYASADEIASKHGFTEEDLARFEDERQRASMHWEDRLQMEFEERVARGANPQDISFG